MVWWFLKKVSVEFSYDPAVPLLVNTPKMWKQEVEEESDVHVHVLHHSQNVDATVKGWMDRHIMV